MLTGKKITGKFAQWREYLFLKLNRSERMDANREDIFNPERAAFHKDRYEFASRYIKGKNVLDVASGLGYGADLMMRQGKASMITGVEIDGKAAGYAQKKYAAPSKIEFIQGSILDLPFADNTFDIVTSFETIEHVRDENRVFAELKRVLKPGGVCVLSTPNRWGVNLHHVRDYDYATLTKLAGEHFQLVEMFNQNSGCQNRRFNRGQPRGMVKTTPDNQQNAECFIVVCKNIKSA